MTILYHTNSANTLGKINNPLFGTNWCFAEGVLAKTVYWP